MWRCRKIGRRPGAVLRAAVNGGSTPSIVLAANTGCSTRQMPEKSAGAAPARAHIPSSATHAAKTHFRRHITACSPHRSRWETAPHPC